MGDASRILLRNQGGPWKQPEIGSYSNERALQDMLLEAPDLLPGVGSAVAVDEMHFPGVGQVDVVVVEPAGTITLIECKLAANSESRRTVVGQVLAYASAAWRTPYETFDDRFRQREGRSLIEAVETIAETDEWDQEEFRRAVSDNLDRGAFRLFVAVDQITDELKGIIEFLNTHTTTELEVLAFEMGYVADGATEILLPRTYGQESARVRAGTGTPKPRWTIDDVFSKLEELVGQEQVAAVRRLYRDVLERGGKVYPGRGQYPTMSAHVTIRGDRRAAWAVYADPSGPGAPRISINFGSWRNNLSDAELESILERLEAVDALAPHLAKVRESDYGVYPTVPLTALAGDAAVDAIVQALAPHVEGV